MTTDLYLRTNGIKRNSENSACVSTVKSGFTRTEGDYNQLKHVGIELKNLLNSHVIPYIESASRLHESVCSTSAKVKWKYSKEKIGGGAGGQTLSGCDLPLNKIG